MRLRFYVRLSANYFSNHDGCEARIAVQVASIIEAGIVEWLDAAVANDTEEDAVEQHIILNRQDYE